MNQEQLNQVRKQPELTSVITIDHLKDRTPRTLIFGYDVERNTHHVYIGQDGAIHRLLYTPAGCDSEGSGPHFMMLEHSQGESAGLKTNAGYIPNKRVYAESCDFEFCMLLALAGVYPTYLEVSEEDDTRRRHDHHGYAGFTKEDGGVTLAALAKKALKFAVFPPEVATEQMASRVIVAACQQLDVRFHLSEGTGTAYSDASRETDVLAKVKSIAETLPADLLTKQHLARHLFEHAFGMGYYPSFCHEHSYGGVFSVSIDGGAPNAFKANDEVDFYEPATSGEEWPKAISGIYEGRRYTAILQSNGYAKLTLSQFGDQERIVKSLEKPYGLKASVPA